MVAQREERPTAFPAQLEPDSSHMEKAESKDKEKDQGKKKRDVEKGNTEKTSGQDFTEMPTCSKDVSMEE